MIGRPVKLGSGNPRPTNLYSNVSFYIEVGEMQVAEGVLELVRNAHLASCPYGAQEL
jgi:hypothetical protein